MSVYYGHQPHSYPVQHHQPPPPAHGYGYYPPAPPPPVQDPHSFRRDYADRLTELTMNSRPIIQSLTMLAHDNTRYADIVTQVIEDHIRRVPPYMKLPAFYLLDMISKNVYDPYARHFSPFVAPLFLEAYSHVDDSTRQKLEELVLTWRTGSPTRKELFGVVAQMAVERGIWGGGASGSNVRRDRPRILSRRPQYILQAVASGSGISKAQVLSELDFTLNQKQRAVETNPRDHESQNHIHVLYQLRGLVEGGVPQHELQAILTQLRNLARSSAPPPPPQQPPPSSGTWAAQSFPPSSYPVAAPQPVVHQGPPPAQPSSSSSTSSSAPLPITDLLTSLRAAGMLSKTGTPVTTPKEEDQAPAMEREVQRSYRHAILSQPVKLSTADITRQRPPIQYFLYDQLSAQCRQCGMRFADTPVGKKELQDHMDMHFRQNRKVNQNVGRGHSRSWFVSIDDWIHDSSDAKGKARHDGSKDTVAAEQAKREAELRAQFVVVPSGDEAKSVSCPICKESLKSEFLEENEDWVWKNAVKKDGLIYHATCHADALTSTTTLAARLRNELTAQSGRSRSRTPERLATPPNILKSLSPSPDSKRLIAAGLKRKAEDSPSLDHKPESTPPMKKVALSV